MTELISKIIALILGYAISWILSAGLYALVCLFLPWGFDWLTATGIWLVLCILKFIF